MLYLTYCGGQRGFQTWFYREFGSLWSMASMPDVSSQAAQFPLPGQQFFKYGHVLYCFTDAVCVSDQLLSG